MAGANAGNAWRGWPALSAVTAVLALSVAMGGCAGTNGRQYADEPGVPVRLSTRDLGEASGSLVAFEDGAFVLDRAYERGETVEVLRSGDIDYVYVDGVVVGTVVEIRDFDIVTRQRIQHRDVLTMDVKTRAYAGWGSVVAGVLAFFLVMVVGDQ